MENKVLAVVNGNVITEMDMENAIQRFGQDKRQSLSTPEGRKQLLDQLISWELLYQDAVDTGMENREDYKLQLQEARKGILTQLAIQDVISSAASVDEEEIKEYYQQNKEYFKGEEQVSAKHILVDTLEKAQQVKEEIASGLSFEDAARKYSSCPSKEQGGSLGSFGRGMMVPEFENAAFEIEEGVVSEPVKTQFGYHLILVEGRTKSQEKPYEEVKELIRSHMVQEKQNSLYIDHVNGLKEKYSIEIK
jgi:peptidyl-prolyl cis-trans isomerase C